MAAEWLDLDYFFLITSSVIGTVICFISRRDDKAIQNLKKAPNVEVGQSLKNLVQNQSPLVLPYIAIRGSVTQLGSQVLTSETGVKGVIQMITVNEHSVRRYSTGFWGDAVREIVHTINEVPFGLKSMTESGSMIIEIVDPSHAMMPNLLSPVSTKFSPATTGFASTIFGFFAGNAATGIETTEKLLPLDTNITAIGHLVVSSGKMRLSCPTDTTNYPYIMSTYPVEHVIETMVMKRTGLRFLSGVCYSVAVIVVIRKGWKLWKAYEEKQMRLRILRERAERAVANRANNPRTNPTSDGNGNSNNVDVQICIICLTNPREVILLPCGHVALCADCLERIDRMCPVCRNAFTSTHVAYIS